MVKPIFPSERSDAIQSWHPNIENHGQASAGAGGDSASFINDNFARILGPVPSSLDVSIEDNVFRNPGSMASASGCDIVHPQSFQPFANTAPRERVSSLPDEQEDARPVQRQRRQSAPVVMDFSAASTSASSSTSDDSASIPPALQDIATKGQELFWFILSEEVKAQEATAPGSFSALTISPSSQRMHVLNERGRFGGRTLRQIAEAFSLSPQRMRVREYAESVHLQSLNYNSFSDLLFGLFQEGGVTQARVLVLFFFCADVALRALRENLTRHFQQLVDWTSRYITEKLSAWVLDHGGWSAVLHESVDQVYKVAVVGICMVSIIALTTMLWRHR